MTFAVQFPVCGMTPSDSGPQPLPAPLISPADSDRLPLGSFGQLVSLHQSNEILFQELSRVNTRLVEARAYLASPGNVPRLAVAHLQRLLARRSAVHGLLQANELEARVLLARLRSDPVAR
jgi:hypothetical protein